MKKSIIVVLVLVSLVLFIGCKKEESDVIPIEQEVEEDKGEPLPEVPEEWKGKTIQELLNEGGASDIVDTTVVNETDNETEEVIDEPKKDVPLGTHLIDIQMMGSNFNFFPNKITINLGETIRWTNHLDYHDKQAKVQVFARHKNLFRSPDLNYGDSYEFAFNETGSYLFSAVPYTEYFKNGEVIVE